MELPFRQGNSLMYIVTCVIELKRRGALARHAMCWRCPIIGVAVCPSHLPHMTVASCSADVKCAGSMSSLHKGGFVALAHKQLFQHRPPVVPVVRCEARPWLMMVAAAVLTCCASAAPSTASSTGCQMMSPGSTNAVAAQAHLREATAMTFSGCSRSTRDGLRSRRRRRSPRDPRARSGSGTMAGRCSGASTPGSGTAGTDEPHGTRTIGRRRARSGARPRCP